jgi:Tfp pilus assembly protein PilF
VQARFSLAAAYLANGQRALSIASLEAAIKIDPRVEAQARAIIAEIRAGRNPLQN